MYRSDDDASDDGQEEKRKINPLARPAPALDRCELAQSYIVVAAHTGSNSSLMRKARTVLVVAANAGPTPHHVANLKAR
ncbi:hypothetical protein [Bradyrhizobium elkanii]|uniref:hypothetical protein n=1 Tax=Bradyrhizobium elkanii TaxID=29448 RepID=UPI003D209DF7